ncbi:hypothetical protein [Rhodoferax sp.]|uniref:hypothetical protein n=1 Tax=Rhodoferax sp. TaxID=50421 RepID=UPI00260C499B|nr:hypothetical protein [Rhodoferax sp.]MDD2926336.1 hypothetical protein [Rhodoferax sp.]
MANTTLHPQGLTHDVQTVSSALHDLIQATHRLLLALWAAFTRHPEPSQVPSALQEANRLRAYADRLYSSDPRYARDLYAAAIRHEQLAAGRETARD